MTDQLFDVDAINITTLTRRKLAEKKTLQDAEAIVKMAVVRRGMSEEFYEIVSSPDGAT